MEVGQSVWRCTNAFQRHGWALHQTCMHRFLPWLVVLLLCGCNERYILDVSDGAATDPVIAPEFHASIARMSEVAKQACTDYFGELQSVDEANGALDIKTADRRVHISLTLDPKFQQSEHTIVEIASHVSGEPSGAILTGRHDVRALFGRMRELVR